MPAPTNRIPGDRITAADLNLISSVANGAELAAAVLQRAVGQVEFRVYVGTAWQQRGTQTRDLLVLFLKFNAAHPDPTVANSGIVPDHDLVLLPRAA